MKQRLSNACAVLLALLLCLSPLSGLAAKEKIPQPHQLELGNYDEEDVAAVLQDLEAQADESPWRGLPTEEQLQFLEALALSNEALMAHTGMSEEKLLRSWVIPIFCIGEDTFDVDGQMIIVREPRWVMNYPNHSVFLDATTGEVITIMGGNPNGNG